MDDRLVIDTRGFLVIVFSPARLLPVSSVWGTFWPCFPSLTPLSFGSFTDSPRLWIFCLRFRRAQKFCLWTTRVGKIGWKCILAATSSPGPSPRRLRSLGSSRNLPQPKALGVSTWCKTTYNVPRMSSICKITCSVLRFSLYVITNETISHLLQVWYRVTPVDLLIVQFCSSWNLITPVIFLLLQLHYSCIRVMVVTLLPM